MLGLKLGSLFSATLNALENLDDFAVRVQNVDLACFFLFSSTCFFRFTSVFRAIQIGLKRDT